MRWKHRYEVKAFFPADSRKHRECRRVLSGTHLDEENGDYMAPVTAARYERAKAHIETVYAGLLEELE